MKHCTQPLLWMAALAISIGCAHQVSDDLASSSAKQPSIATRDASQRLASQEAIGEEARTSRDNELGLTKNRDEEWDRRFNELGRELGPQTNALHAALLTADWEDVLRLTDELSAAWNNSGLATRSYASERAEALIGLGRPVEALALIDPYPNHRDTPTSLTMALAMAMLGELDAVSARGLVKHGLRFMEGDVEPLLPNPQTFNDKLACVRTARALEGGAGGSPELDEKILREAREALRLDPSQKLAAYVLAEAAGRRNLKTEALANWRVASTLPGELGEHARKMVKSYEHVIAIRG